MKSISKIRLYLLSLLPFFLLFFILYLDIPPIKFCGGYTFIGVKNLLRMNYLPLIALFFIIVDLIIWIKIKGLKLNSANLPATVVSVHNVNEGALDFAASILIPLVFIEVNSINSFIVLVFSLIFIGCIYIKTDRIYSSPTLVILGFSLYVVEIKISKNQIDKEFVLSRNSIKLKNKIKMTKISDNYYYASIVGVNKNESK